MNVPNSPISKSVETQVKKSSEKHDKLLQALVSVPERTSLELGITLNANGLLITGYIISQESYFDALIEGVKATKADTEVKDLLEDFLAQLKGPILESSSERENSPSFIHLRDVKIYPSEGRGMPNLGHALWRGSISEISGFSLGEMVPTQFESPTKVLY